MGHQVAPGQLVAQDSCPPTHLGNLFLGKCGKYSSLTFQPLARERQRKLFDLYSPLLFSGVKRREYLLLSLGGSRREYSNHICSEETTWGDASSSVE